MSLSEIDEFEALISPIKQQWMQDLRGHLGLSSPKTSETPDAPEAPDLSEMPEQKPGPEIKVRPATGAFVKLQQARILWSQTEQSVQRALDETAKGLLADFEDEEAARALRQVLGELAEELTEALDALLSAPPGPGRDIALKEAREAAIAYETAAGRDPVLGVLDGSPYTSIKAGSLLIKTLGSIRANLS